MIERIISDLQEQYRDKPHRLNHVLGVRDTALALGELHGADLHKLELAALLHDSTKYLSHEENVRLIESYFPNSGEIIREYNIHILHAFSAVVVARNTYGISDTDILDAIMSHTIGRPNMSIYEAIIFISDYIEPNRTYDSCVKVREIAFDNLNLAIYTAIDDSITYYETHGGHIPETAYQARAHYKQELEEQP